MTDQEIIDKVRPFHCLKDPDVELPALFEATRQAKTILEIGTFQGATACALVLKNPLLKVVTIDLPDPSLSTYNAQSSGECGKAIRELELGRNIEQVRMDSCELGRFIVERRKFDVIFVDGDHSAKVVMRDLLFCAQMLTPKGVIIVHDYTEEEDYSSQPSQRPWWTRDVYEAVEMFLRTFPTFDLVRLPGWLAKLTRSYNQN